MQAAQKISARLIPKMSDEDVFNSVKEHAREATSSMVRNMSGNYGYMSFLLDEIYKRVEKDGLSAHVVFESTVHVMASLSENELQDQRTVVQALAKALLRDNPWIRLAAKTSGTAPA